MKKIVITIFMLAFLSSGMVMAENRKDLGNPPATISLQGKVIDHETMEELAGVTVELAGTDIKTYTDIDGNFKIDNVQPGRYTLNISYISYKEKSLKDLDLSNPEDDNVEIELEQVN